MNKSYSLTSIKLCKVKPKIISHTTKLFGALINVLNQPEKVIMHEINSPKAASNTLLNDQYKPLTPQQLGKIKNNTILPINRDLIPTVNRQKVNSMKFRVIDAHQKILGSPINQQHLHRILKSQPKYSQIVYQYVGKKDQTLQKPMLQSCRSIKTLKFNKRPRKYFKKCIEFATQTSDTQTNIEQSTNHQKEDKYQKKSTYKYNTQQNLKLQNGECNLLCLSK